MNYVLQNIFIAKRYFELIEQSGKKSKSMGRKNFNNFVKNQKANKKRKKREEKLQRKEAKKFEDTSGKLEDMIAFVDEFGQIVNEPPEDTPAIDEGTLTTDIDLKKEDSTDNEEDNK